MVRGWDQASHEALLMALIDEIKPGKAVLTEVTKRMKDAGWQYSYDAIKYLLSHLTCLPSTYYRVSSLTNLSYSQHIQKLRKNRDTSGINTAAGSNAAAAGTPAKGTPKKTPTPRKRATPKKANGKKAAAPEDEADDDFGNLVKKEEDQASDVSEKRPAKRVKQEAT